MDIKPFTRLGNSNTTLYEVVNSLDTTLCVQNNILQLQFQFGCNNLHVNMNATLEQTCFSYGIAPLYKHVLHVVFTDAL